MKAEELMIGDWVKVFDGFKRITQIRNVSNKKEFYSVWCDEWGMYESDLEPIPLTAEILEKNGFHKQKWNDLVTEFVFATDLNQSPQTVIQFTFYSKEIEGVRSLLKMWTKSKFGHGQNDVHLCGIYYVHELQHALRLCGIDKEIIL